MTATFLATSNFSFLPTYCVNEGAALSMGKHSIDFFLKNGILQLHFICVWKLNKLLIAGAQQLAPARSLYLGGDERYKLISHNWLYLHCIRLQPDCSRPVNDLVNAQRCPLFIFLCINAYWRVHVGVLLFSSHFAHDATLSVFSRANDFFHEMGLLIFFALEHAQLQTAITIICRHLFGGTRRHSSHLQQAA